jgi:hypothetical protein
MSAVIASGPVTLALTDEAALVSRHGTAAAVLT